MDNTKTALELPDAEGGVKIELRDLWFKYPTRDIPIFQGLNLTVRHPLFPLYKADSVTRFKRGNLPLSWVHPAVAKPASSPS